ncbi:transcription elongation factor [uncultured Nonlabens sp.]|uniref:transcription elongation factor n=1 Tax=uncultured Nonlabens sp. TaxID=859306 RepID=UPI00261C40E1|nr:transcription elongation factor [uncultured Nonlabens sp.]
MNTIDFPEFKKAINTYCLETVGQRLTIIKKNLDSLMDAKRNETKSSAGDKYETGRAMIQNEEELYKRQRAETSIILDQLLRIDPDKECSFIEPGALVVLPSGYFYIAAGMGKLVVNGMDCFAVSLSSPIGQALKSKKKGDTIIFQNREVMILNVF